MSHSTFPYKYDDLFDTVLTALHKLGGSASINEIEEAAVGGTPTP